MDHQLGNLNVQLESVEREIHRLCGEWSSLKGQMEESRIMWLSSHAYPGHGMTITAYPIAHQVDFYYEILADPFLSQYPSHPLYQITTAAINLVVAIDRLVASKKELMDRVYEVLSNQQIDSGAVASSAGYRFWRV